MTEQLTEFGPNARLNLIGDRHFGIDLRLGLHLNGYLVLAVLWGFDFGLGFLLGLVINLVGRIGIRLRLELGLGEEFRLVRTRSLKLAFGLKLGFPLNLAARAGWRVNVPVVGDNHILKKRKPGHNPGLITHNALEN